jgi:light-regulated signal transduction histidine kinase (bacteriophytochrome)
MSGFAKFLSKDYAEKLDDRGKDYLTRIGQGSVRMIQLIEDILRLSKISLREVEKKEVDMSKIAARIISRLRETDPARSVEVSIEEGLIVHADPGLVEIILSNLLGNAWKFTSKTETARIEFGALKEKGKTVYCVRDNGAGFDPQYAKKMFSPFHRLHHEKEFEGTGIGLAIVERIIRRHGGRIWAEGDVGKGAAFSFTLK